MKRTLFLMPMLFVLLLAGCGGIGATPTVAVDPEAEREALGTLSVPLLQGAGDVSLPVAGKPTVINFWASWCGPCRAEMPEFAALASERSDVAVVGLLHDDTAAAGQAFADELGITFPLGRDPDGSIYDRFGSVGLPLTVFVDAQGRVASTWFGPLDRATLDAFVDQLAT